MTPQEFLQDTIDHFNSGNRGVGIDGACSYWHGCAIGRHLAPEVRIAYDDADVEGGTDILSIFEGGSEFIEQAPPWMQHMRPKFLYDVQRLHDDPYSWGDSGLTSIGIGRVREICQQLNLTVTFKTQDNG